MSTEIQPGDRVKMTNLRDGTTRTVTVVSTNGLRPVVEDSSGTRWSVDAGFLSPLAATS